MSATSNGSVVLVTTIIIFLSFWTITVILYLCISGHASSPSSSSSSSSSWSSDTMSGEAAASPDFSKMESFFFERQNRKAKHRQKKWDEAAVRWKDNRKIRPSTAHTEEVLKAYELDFPPNDTDRIRTYVHDELRVPTHRLYSIPSELPYDVYNCPDTPDEGYPMEWNTLDLLRNWNPGNVTIPAMVHHGLCIFDYERDGDFDKAQTYRTAEVPFLLQNYPSILQTSERWTRNSSQYLSQLLDQQPQRVEHSKTRHFMYFKARPDTGREYPDWEPPMTEEKMTFEEWYRIAESVDPVLDEQDRYYVRLNGAYEMMNHFLYQELPIFDFHVPDNFFMVDPDDQRGINCRFGMSGVIAEAHYDQSRNFIVQMGPGQRRYVLSHPRSCVNLCLHPQGHPSGRHSSVDWTRPTEAARDCPDFADGRMSEVVLQAGDALYLPTYWFHFIVSLNTNYQCNARSGITFGNRRHVIECGFS